MINLLTNLLEDAARIRPDHPAVEDARGSLSYGELADRAGRLAAQLKKSNIQQSDRVGVMMPKSSDAVASLYGIMASGAAYVPLDIGAPTPRLAYMIRNCGMKSVCTCMQQAKRLIGQLDGSGVQQLVLMDADEVPESLAGNFEFPVITRAEVMDCSPLDHPASVGPDDLAYILYTSGSTGQPKGVMISHRNALAFVDWSCDEVQVGPNDRLSSHAPFHFDLSIFDLYVASRSQATLVLVPDGASMFPPSLAQWIDSAGITVWYSVPSILIQMWERGRVDRFNYPKLRKIIFAGEVFATKYLRSWMEKLPHADWFNFYGPTETNVCTAYRVPAPPSGDAPVSIGTGSSGDTIYLRNNVGVAITDINTEGEIVVDGPTVALGYWADEQQTAARFVVDEKLTGSTRTLYCTGDVAIWNDSGNLTFKGRRDHMIKSRGYRIELGEIESAAYSHDQVNEVCVVAVPDDQIGNRIRACVVRHKGTSLDRNELERHLAKRIPGYMLPQEVFFLEQLPKTSTGKIDRVSLENQEPSIA